MSCLRVPLQEIINSVKYKKLNGDIIVFVYWIIPITDTMIVLYVCKTHFLHESVTWDWIGSVENNELREHDNDMITWQKERG